jgi:hypothetical protein
MRTLSPIIKISLVVTLLVSACEIMPRNTLKDCQDQCKGSKKSKACYDFCDCIHKQGQPLDSCLDKYDKAPQHLIENR